MHFHDWISHGKRIDAVSGCRMLSRLQNAMRREARLWWQYNNASGVTKSKMVASQFINFNRKDLKTGISDKLCEGFSWAFELEFSAVRTFLIGAPIRRDNDEEQFCKVSSFHCFVDGLSRRFDGWSVVGYPKLNRQEIHRSWLSKKHDGRNSSHKEQS